MDDDIVRILVATDNHLGFAERDSIRLNDSFAAFEEVLITAKERKVDLLLLAGDMFHENKPSRRTMHTAMNLLRTHCLGEEPVFIEILNEQSEVFKTGPLGKVNYEDPFQSVSLPVFAIHGNHDDPSREGGSGESLAALDLLSVSNLINYFGKSEQVDDIEITPILMRKGTTCIALYGLGAIRDERLNRMWNLKKVKFVRPTEEQGKERFFNIFVLHQNRDYGRGSKNCVHESMIPQWMDVVIWGNEHECQPRLSESLVGTYRIYQPGSSVSTSLVEGESMSHPKGMGLLEIRLKKFRLKSIVFNQIRPFVYGDLSLADWPELNANDPKIEEKIKDILTKRVNSMILEAREKSSAVDNSLTNILKYRVLSPFQVLVRLRVENEGGYPTVNQQRFGSQFVGEVANPSDLIFFAKKKKDNDYSNMDRNKNKKRQSTSDLLQMIQEGEVEAIYKINIEDLVNETLGSSNKELSVLVEAEMAQVKLGLGFWI
jgi:double-strand break repair protein MRE11